VRKSKADRRRKLLRIAIVLALVFIIAIAAVYNFLHSTLTVALMESLSTFKVAKVGYPSVQPDSIQLNITYSLENPTDFSIIVETIAISLSVNGKHLIGVNLPLNEDLPAGAKTFFHSIRDVTDKNILNSIRNQTYTLGVEGEIVGSTSYLFVQAHINKELASFESIKGP